MKLHDIFHTIEIKRHSHDWESNPSINALSFHSKKVKKGGLFFAIRGYEVDGHDFLTQAFKNGASLAVVEELEKVDKAYQSECIVVENSRKVLAYASANFFRHPTRELTLVGVTGTNGKTSCVHILDSIFKAAGHITALMGTVQSSYLDYVHLSDHTTRESLEIQSFLRKAVDSGVDMAIMEISSHALSLFRVNACEFDAVLFTNLDLDHQDFYKGIEPYFQAKLELFTKFNEPFDGVPSKKNIVGISNFDDTYGRRVLKEANIPMKSFSFFRSDDGIHYGVSQWKMDTSGMEGVINRDDGSQIKVKSALTTTFNSMNILASAATASVMGVSNSHVSQGIEDTKELPGRLLKVPTTLPYDVFIDFAHSGTALYSVLKELRAICVGKLIAVFGAGGDKDPLRRVLMGEASAKFANIAIITTDNPRREDPQEIIEAITTSWRAYARKNKLQGELIVEADREQAIRRAIFLAKEKDVICIAGKGHERVQIVGDKLIPFDDREVAEKALRELENV